jgi:hypothetical protein
MGNLNETPPVVVVYQSSDAKPVISIDVFNHARVDDIIDGTRRKPLIPYYYEILEIGVGKTFIEKYKHKYKIENEVYR